MTFTYFKLHCYQPTTKWKGVKTYMPNIHELFKIPKLPNQRILIKAPKFLHQIWRYKNNKIKNRSKENWKVWIFGKLLLIWCLNRFSSFLKISLLIHIGQNKIRHKLISSDWTRLPWGYKDVDHKVFLYQVSPES